MVNDIITEITNITGNKFWYEYVNLILCIVLIS